MRLTYSKLVGALHHIARVSFSGRSGTNVGSMLTDAIMFSRLSAGNADGDGTCVNMLGSCGWLSPAPNVEKPESARLTGP